MGSEMRPQVFDPLSVWGEVSIPSPGSWVGSVAASKQQHEQPWSGKVGRGEGQGEGPVAPPDCDHRRP